MLNTILIIGGFQVLMIVAGVARLKAIAVLLGPEGVGVMSLVDQVVLFVMQASVVSIPFAVLTFLSRAYREGRDAFARSYLGFLQLLVMLTLTGTAIALALVIGGGVLSAQLFGYRPLLIVGLLSVPTLALRAFLINVLAAAQQARASSVLALVNALALLAATVVGISIGGLAGLYWGNLVTGILVVGGLLGYAHRRLQLPLFSRTARFREELKGRPELVPFCLTYYLVPFTPTLAWLIARHAVIEHFGETEAGLFQGAIGLATALSMVMAPVNYLLFLPTVNRQADRAQQFHDAVEYQRKLVIMLSLLAMPLVLFPRWTLIAVYSAAFSAAAPYVHVLVLAEVLLLLAGVYQALIVGLDDVRAYTLVYLGGYVWLGVLSWLVAPHYGILGVSVVAITASALMLVMARARLQAKHGFRPPPGLDRLASYALSALVVAGLLGRYDDGEAMVLVKFAVLVGFALSVVRLLDGEDRAAVYRLLAVFRPSSTPRAS